jgi:hypothetical protein
MIKMNFYLILSLLILLGSSAFSLPRFSLMFGNKCIDCHFNPTGGMIRNLDGWDFGKNILSANTPREKDFLMSPRIGDNIYLGLDYRTQYLYSQQKNKTDFQQMTGSLYTNIGLSKNINLLGRYDFIYQIWEAYGVAHILPNNSYIKVGSFQPNFGIRIDDHTAYTRGGDYQLLSSGGKAGLIYNPLYTEAGIESGFYISDWGLLTASVGSYPARGTFSADPTYTARLEIDPQLGKVNLMFGGSYANTKLPRTADFYGGFAGVGYQRFSLLGEFDLGNNVTASELKSNYAMAEAAYIVSIGLQAVVRYDRFDPNTSNPDDELQHIIFGVEWYPYSFIEIRPQYRFILENPSVKNDAVVIQFHFWY